MAKKPAKKSTTRKPTRAKTTTKPAGAKSAFKSSLTSEIQEPPRSILSERSLQASAAEQGVRGLASPDESADIMEAQEAYLQELGLRDSWTNTDQWSQARAFSARGDIAEVGMNNIVGCDVGMKMNDSGFTGAIGIRFFVQEKTKSAVIPKGMMIEPTYVHKGKEYQTDVMRVGLPQPHASAVPCGSKITNQSYSARHGGRGFTGTIGCLVVDHNNSNTLSLISNTHVLAPDNNGISGDKIAFGGPSPGGPGPAVGNGVLAVLREFERLNFGSSTAQTVDVGVAETNPDLVKPAFLTFQINPTPAVAVPAMSVMKIGATTGFRLGHITGTNAVVTVAYDGGNVTFEKQLTCFGGTTSTTMFSRSGDSGSLIVASETKRPVGLLFAGNEQNGITWANPIQTVLQRFNLSIYAG